MATFTYTWDTERIKGLVNQGLERAVVAAARKAGRDALRALRTDSVKALRERKRFKASALRKALTPQSPKGARLENLAWTLTVSGRPMPLASFPYRGTKRKGVRVEVNVGRPKYLRNAFVATMRSGHTGIFERVGRARLPIRELYSTRVTDVFRDAGFVPERFARAGVVFGSTFDRVLPLEIQRLSTR